MTLGQGSNPSGLCCLACEMGSQWLSCLVLAEVGRASVWQVLRPQQLAPETALAPGPALHTLCVPWPGSSAEVPGRLGFRLTLLKRQNNRGPHTCRGCGLPHLAKQAWGAVASTGPERAACSDLGQGEKSGP